MSSVSHDRASAGAGSAAAVLIALAAIVIAATGLRASMLASDASGEWESSVRIQVQEGAGEVNDALLVYDEALYGGRIAEARFRSDELRREAAVADLSTSTPLLAESTVLSALAEALGGPDDGAAAERAMAVGERLAERRRLRTSPDEPLPHELAEEGSRLGRRATLAAAAAAPAGLAFLLGALAQAFPRRRRLLLIAGAVCLVLAGAAVLSVELFGP